MSRIRQVTFEEFNLLLEFAIEEHKNSNEPIPQIQRTQHSAVMNCLINPFQTFGGQFLYKGFVEKAVMLLYCLIKNHPLSNGNKRMAILTFTYFHHINKKKIKLTDDEIYDLVVQTAKSNDFEQAKKNIKRILKKR